MSLRSRSPGRAVGRRRCGSRSSGNIWPEMKKFRMMIASDVFTTARVVAQPTPSEPPNVERPQ